MGFGNGRSGFSVLSLREQKAWRLGFFLTSSICIERVPCMEIHMVHFHQSASASAISSAGIRYLVVRECKSGEVWKDKAGTGEAKSGMVARNVNNGLVPSRGARPVTSCHMYCSLYNNFLSFRLSC